MATESFVQQLTSSQNRLYGYIYSLIGDHHRAADVLQETNLVLWRKADEFRPGADFIPWAFAIARFQVMANIRDKGRDRCVLDPDLLELISEELEEPASHFQEMQEALRHCLNKLPTNSREMIDCKYFNGQSIKQLAAKFEKSTDATKSALVRIRKGLRECVKNQVAKQA